jgi:hypothetical protein
MYIVDILALSSIVYADVRIQPKQAGAPPGVTFRMPDTFGIAALAVQKRTNLDQFIRSNVDNEANKRNTATEAALDMMPCRQAEKGPAMQFTRGQAQEIPLRWNNPHDSDCEFNIWTDGLTRVAPIKRPFTCGGGFQNQRVSFTVPSDFPAGKCESAAENCVLQLYAHSVEPRTYAMCVDFTLTAGVARSSNSTLTKRQTINNQKDIPTTQFQPAVHFNDAFDTAHVDSQYSGYRGQQPQFIRDELKAAIQLQSFTPNGGLVPLGDVNKQQTKQMRNQVQKAVKAAEKLAIQRNRAAQAKLNAEARAAGTPRTCFEGELYNVVNNANCARQFTNTYVTNVGYRELFNQFLPQFQAANLTQYAPKTKTEIGTTPEDPFGQFRVNGRPSLAPRGQARGAAAPQRFTGRPLGEPESIAQLASFSQPLNTGKIPANLQEAAARVNEVLPNNPDDDDTPTAAAADTAAEAPAANAPAPKTRRSRRGN